MAELDVPAVVKEIRRTLDLTQEQLAREVGVSFTSVNHWERGKRRPIPLAVDKLKELAARAGLDITLFKAGQDATTEER
jgi:transcriptional regulator with XRE-family HTH domain